VSIIIEMAGDIYRHRHHPKEPRKRYIPVSNRTLHELLLQKLGFDEDDENAPSNQKPRQILDALGLLGEEKYQRINTLAFDKNSKRIYNIYKITLKRVIEDSIYKDLILKIHTSLTIYKDLILKIHTSLTPLD